jgi:hypothetical protein
MEGMRATNVDGLVNVTRAVVDGMKQRKFGRIVNLSDVGRRVRNRDVRHTTYAATKAAVSVMNPPLRDGLGPHGVTVNAVAPGFILTDMAGQRRSSDDIAKVAEKAMVKRVGQPEDRARGRFPCAPESSFITAQILTVDGGRWIISDTPESLRSPFVVSFYQEGLLVPGRTKVAFILVMSRSRSVYRLGSTHDRNSGDGPALSSSDPAKKRGAFFEPHIQVQVGRLEEV